MTQKSPANRNRKSASFRSLGFASRSRPRFRFVDLLLWGIFICTVLTLSLALVGERGIFRLMILRKETQQVRMRSEKLLQANGEIRREIFQLKTDPTVIEQIAREELGLVKSDEMVFKFSDP